MTSRLTSTAYRPPDSTGPSRTTSAPPASAAVAAPDQTMMLYWLLRLAVGLEFLGHGAFGIITKAAWVPYYGVVGIPERWAWRMMPVTGTVDIFLGFLVVLKPVRLALLYMAIWGLWTALLRPLSGENGWEVVERAPNYLIPFALLYLRGLPRSWRELVS